MPYVGLLFHLNSFVDGSVSGSATNINSILWPKYAIRYTLMFLS
jgi:hypothetical protein